MTAAISDVEPLGRPQDGYRASMDMYDLGALQLVSFQQDKIVFHHTNDHVRRSGIDHWWLSAAKRSNTRSGATADELDPSPGSVRFKSFAVPFSGVLESAEFSCLFMSRDDFWGVADLLDRVSHKSVEGPMTQILGEFLISLERHAGTMTRAEVPALNDAYSCLLKAALNPNADALEEARRPIAAVQFERARRYINENLKAPGLTPDTLVARLGISRRQLYYLFRHHGGVVHYIRTRRLAACYNALADMTTMKFISSVAYEYGFTHLSSFYRQFHAQYGFSPGEARGAAPADRRPNRTAASTFADWMSRIDSS